jgi:hypothetical protein
METLVSAKRQNLSFKPLEIIFQKCTKHIPNVFREEFHCSLFSFLCFIINFLYLWYNFSVHLKDPKCSSHLIHKFSALIRFFFSK